MAPVVIDAAAAVELVRRTTAGKRAAEEMRGNTVVAPAHLDAEVLSALARLARDDPDDAPHLAARLRHLARAPIRRYLCAPLLQDAWALRGNIATRDALYVALARRLRATLLTADARLGRAVSNALGGAVHIDVIEGT